MIACYENLIILLKKQSFDHPKSFKKPPDYFQADLTSAGQVFAQCSTLFSKLKLFDLTASLQKEHFINTLIFPIFTYNIKLWYFSSTINDHTKLLKLFEGNNFYTDMDHFVADHIHKLASDQTL